jgi:hypothetical protein
MPPIWTEDDERIYRYRGKIRDAEERLAALRSALSGAISQRRATLPLDDGWDLCPVCGRMNRLDELGQVPQHNNCRGFGLKPTEVILDGGL